MARPLLRAGLRLVFALAVFAAMAAAIISRPDKRLTDFDQSFYLTIAYDLIHHGTFSNGIFDQVDGTRASPPPGMFFAPLYPLTIAAAAKLDARFARALDCAIEANEHHRDLVSCEIYAVPLHLAHALFVAAGVLAIAAAGEAIFAGAAVFYFAGALAALGIALEADLLSFLMTESQSFAMFSLFGLALVRALKTARIGAWALVGVAAAVASLVRPTFLLLIPIALVLIGAVAVVPSLRGAKRRSNPQPQAKDWIASAAEFTPGRRESADPGRPSRNDGDPRSDDPSLGRRLVFALPFAAALIVAAGVVLTPWLLRNAVSVGKIGFTEEYGAAAIVERLAFNSMTGREFALTVPYCVPTIGPAVVTALAGEDAMTRFQWNAPGSFFELGRGRREALVQAHGKLDPVIGDLVRADMARDWWRHIGTSLALSWCGLWVSGLWSVLLLPLFAVACVVALRRCQPLFLLYAAPALVLVGVHGVLANHYPRYNLGLIGPFAVGAAWLVLEWLGGLRSVRPVSPVPCRAPEDD